MSTHLMPVPENKHYISCDDSSSWLLLWDDFDTFLEESVVIMLDSSSNMVVMPESMFQDSFVPDPDAADLTLPLPFKDN